MAFTSTDLATIESAIRSILSNPTKQVEVNGRSYTKYDLPDLMNLRDRIQAEVNAATYGGAVKVAFERVTE